MADRLQAGLSTAVISPPKGLRLRGYPHYPRYNTGIHDDLYASCMYLNDGTNEIALVGMDIVLYPKKDTERVRAAAAAKTSIPPENIMICASHTHSGPWTSTGMSVDALEENIQPDTAYVDMLREKLVNLIIEAYSHPFEASVGIDYGICGAEKGIGGNRRDADGPVDPQVWTIGIKDSSGSLRGCAVKYALHPTVLHADNTLISADYPGYIREYVRNHHKDAVFLFMQGTSGNQSSRFFRNDQTFEEAQRFGYTLGEAVEQVLEGLHYSADVAVRCVSEGVETDLRKLPPRAEAEDLVSRMKKRYKALKGQGASYRELQTADLFLLGAEDLLTLINAVESKKKLDILEDDLPSEVQVFSIGDTCIVGFQGEIFVEFGLAVQERSPCAKTFAVELANGRFPGYICTPDAYKKGGYESGMSLVAEDTGSRLVEKAVELLTRVRDEG
jgi:hypothetical protein